MIFIMEKIIASLAMAFCVFMIATQKRRIASVSRKAGKILLELNRPSRKNVILIWVLCPLIIFLTLLTKRNQFMTILMSLLAVSAMYATCKDDSFNSNNGIYETGIILSGNYIPYENIESLSETESYFGYNVSLKSGKTVQVYFSSEEEKTEAVKELEKKIRL